MRAARAALAKHAEDVTVLDLRALSSVTDFFVLCTAETQRQMQAVIGHIEEKLVHHTRTAWRVEGLGGTSTSAKRRPRPLSGSAFARHTDGLAWVLIDCGDLVVHVFNPPARLFYQLERLWADAPRIPLPIRA